MRDTQARYCLGGDFPHCPAYMAASTAARGRQASTSGARRSLARPWLAGAVLLFVLIALTVWALRMADRGDSGGVAQDGPPTPTAIAEAPATSGPSLSPTPTPMSTPSPTPTPMPTQATASPIIPSRVTEVASSWTVEPTRTPAAAPAGVPLVEIVRDRQTAPRLDPTMAATLRRPLADLRTPTPTPDGPEVIATAEISFIYLPPPAGTPEPVSAPGGEALAPELSEEDAWSRLRPTPTDTPRPVPTFVSRVPDRIVAPAIGLDARVVPVAKRIVEIEGQPAVVWDVAQYAAGWHEDSALPGQAGNIVISGHHNTKGEVFRHLHELEPGDEVLLYASGEPRRYIVNQKMILKEKGEPLEVRQRNARWIGSFPEERLTLVTCWPYTGNSHRVIVVAFPEGDGGPPRPIPPAGSSSGR
ncbi:MAG: hypothetical protein Kow0047_25090 [Anaerolineae bacterium]